MPMAQARPVAHYNHNYAATSRNSIPMPFAVSLMRIIYNLLNSKNTQP